MKSQTDVAVLNRSSLRVGQRSLYALLVEKLEFGDRLTYKEAEAIWLQEVAQHIVKGRPHRGIYTYDKARDFWPFTLVPMTRDEVRFAVLNWLTRNLGLLVIKGYLKVIPMVELSDVQLYPPDNAKQEKQNNE